MQATTWVATDSRISVSRTADRALSFTCNQIHEDLCAECVPRDKPSASYALSPVASSRPVSLANAWEATGGVPSPGRKTTWRHQELGLDRWPFELRANCGRAIPWPTV